jgi:uracil-DNA glycosylase
MDLFNYVPEPWQGILGEIKPTLATISHHLDKESVNPKIENVFAALHIPPEKVKVVILGQDPYPDPRHATGVAFSIPEEISVRPPTLRNILKEYVDDLGFPEPPSGDLSRWMEEGVLLLNPILTCKSGVSLTHQGIGWEEVSHHLLSSLSSPKIVGVLWGKKALDYQKFFAQEMTVASPHPSPLSAYRGFFGSKPFSTTNERLIGAGISPINWRL